MKKLCLVIVICISLIISVQAFDPDDLVQTAEDFIDERVKFTSSYFLVEKPSVEFIGIYDYEGNYYVTFYISKAMGGDLKERLIAVQIDQNNNVVDLKISPLIKKTVTKIPALF